MEGSAQQPSSEEVLRELADLRRRVEVLEGALPRSAPTQQHIDQQLPQPIEQQIAHPPTPAPPGSTPSPPPEPAGQGMPSALESRIGAQIFNRVGVFAILAGVAWFLKLAIDREWIGPPLRVLIGLITAAGLIVWSEHFRRCGARSFSFTLKALGSGIAYLSLWACFSLYHLLPATPVFAAMIAVTVVNAVLAWRQNSELLAALALAGGLATPALLATGGDQELFLLSYLLVLDIGAIALTAFRPWASLTFGAFTGTTIYLALGYSQYFTLTATTVTGTLVALFFAAFTAAPFLGQRGQQSGAVSADPSLGMLAYFPIAVGICSFIEGAALVANIDAFSGASWVALGMASVYLAIVCTSLTALAKIDRQSPNTLDSVHLAIAITFFALAAYTKYRRNGIALCWLGELVLLAIAAAYFAKLPIARVLRMGASLLLLLPLCILLRNNVYWHLSGRAQPFTNTTFLVSLTGLAAFSIVALIGLKVVASAQHESLPQPHTFSSWAFLIAAAVLAFNLIALLSVNLQIEFWWRAQLPRFPQGITFLDSVPHRHPPFIDFTQSAWFMFYGAALMAIGFSRRSPFLRWQALILLTLSIAKVFLFDTSHLHEGYRVASFLGLGVLLLTVSFAYQRDWLGLRQRGG